MMGRIIIITLLSLPLFLSGQIHILSTEVAGFDKAAEGDFYVDENGVNYLGLQDGSLKIIGNVTQKGNANGDILVWDNTENEWVAQTPVVSSPVSADANNSISTGSDGLAYFAAYEKIVIWAEESGSLSDNRLEWSFGDRDTGNIGIPLVENWEAYAVSFHADNSGSGNTVEVEVRDMRDFSGIFNFTASGDANNMIYTEVLATPVQLTAGTCLGFRTVDEIGAVSSARVAVWLRRRP